MISTNGPPVFGIVMDYDGWFFAAYGTGCSFRMKAALVQFCTYPGIEGKIQRHATIGCLKGKFHLAVCTQDGGVLRKEWLG